MRNSLVGCIEIQLRVAVGDVAERIDERPSVVAQSGPIAYDAFGIKTYSHFLSLLHVVVKTLFHDLFAVDDVDAFPHLLCIDTRAVDMVDDVLPRC